MAKPLPLPKKAELPTVVLFHREHPTDERVILQVPNAEATDAETYILRMDQEEHQVWLGFLPRARELKTMLEMVQHVRYHTDTGYMEELPDLDAPTHAERVLRHARDVAAPRIPHQDRFAARKRRAKLPPISRLRRYLGSKVR